MRLEDDDKQFEQYLRQFAPRPATPLPALNEAPPSRARTLLAVAALVVLAFGVAIWQAVKPEGLITFPRPTGATIQTAGDTAPLASVSLGTMNRLLNEDPARFDTALTEASRNVLPNVRRPNGSLWALAQD
jgi:hypothetical protein